MMVQLPDGMWISPGSVNYVYADEEKVVINLGPGYDTCVWPEDCGDEFKELDTQGLADKVAEVINTALGRRF